MNRHLTLLAAVAMSLFSISCDKDDTQSDPFISITTPSGVNPTSITIEATAYSQDFTINSNAAWRIEKQPATANWLTISPSEGSGDATIKVSALANEQATRIQAMLIFYSGDTKLNALTIIQNPANAYLNVDPAQPDTIPADGGDLVLNVSTNAGTWDAQITGENSEWLTEKERTETSITFTAAANPNNAEQTATITFTSKEHPDFEETVTIKQNAKEAIYMDLTPEEEPYVITIDGGDLRLIVGTNATSWDAVISGENSEWLTERERTETSITFTADANLTPDQLSATITFTTTEDDPDFEKVITINQEGLIADLLDIQFQEDGTAIDISPMHRNVETFEGPNFSTVYLDSYKRYAGRFSPAELATSISNGFLKVDYKGDEAYKNAIADGHSMEMLIMLNSDLKIGSEVKMFSSMQSGGTGFLLSKETNEFTFLPNIGGWKWCYSGVVPQKGVYYHVVGVWNKDAGKAYIYINGELKGETDASGDFSFPATDTCHWFCIGGDPSSETGTENCWIGDIGIARIYDKPLSDKQVAALYDMINE